MSGSASGLRRLSNEAGIICSLGLYGLIQERIMSEPYEDEFFRTSLFLVLCNRVVAIAYTLTIIQSGKVEDFKNKAPLWKYLAISASSVAATWCQYEALRYVSYPVQTLGKSFKMMPVMLWGLCLSQRRYGFQDWLAALAVTVGVTQFLLGGEIKSKYASVETSLYGLALLLAFLACDGFTSSFQERLFKVHKTSTYNQMLYVNLGSAAVSAVSLAISGDSTRVVDFCLRHLDFVTHTMWLSTTAVAGQSLIYTQVKDYGALALAATMNMRQVLSILCSYVYYQHPISALQVSGLVLVFGALFGKHCCRGLLSRRGNGGEDPKGPPKPGAWAATPTLGSSLQQARGLLVAPKGNEQPPPASGRKEATTPKECHEGVLSSR